MKINYLIICTLLILISISNASACHDTGDSNCTPERNSSYNSGQVTDENHDHVTNFNNEDKNSDPNGFFSNDPYQKTYFKNNSNNQYNKEYLKNYSAGSSITDINRFRTKEEVKNLISTEINKLSTDDLSFKNVNKLSFLLNSIKDTIRKDPSMSLSEKDDIINNIDNLRDTYLNKMQRTMLIKYDFGYFLSDLSKIISLPVENMKNKSSYLNKIVNLLIGDMKNQQLGINESQNNINKFDERVENINKKINDLDYINKLYVLLEPKQKKNNSTFRQNLNKINQSQLDKKEIELLIKSLNKTLKTNERKINNDEVNSQFNLEKTKYELNEIKKQIQDINYVSKVFDLIGETKY